MPDIFKSAAGKIVLVESATPARIIPNIDISTLAGSFAADDADILITSIAVSQQVRLAIFNTLNEDLFIYPLGNEASKCVIQGLAVSSDGCSTSEQYSGVDTIFFFYDTFKATGPNFTKLPVKLVIPPVTLEGYIDGMSLQLNSDANSLGFAKFSFNMTLLPTDS